MSQSLSQVLLPMLEEELLLGVDPDVEERWNKKIASGIVPTGEHFDPEVHKKETAKLVEFEVETLIGLLNGRWKNKDYSTISTIHYFGIGTGKALTEVVKLANRANYRVNAYDVSSFATQNMNEVLGAMDRLHNKILLADIEDVCGRKELFKKGDKIIAPRVLEILSKQEQNWQKKAKGRRKSARTARKMGSLLSLVEILLINPNPEDNVGVIWGDGSPDSLETLATFMAEGLKKDVIGEILGNTSFYKRTHTAAILWGEEGV